MQRILILTHEFPPFHGGIAAVAHGVAAGAAGLGYETHVLAPDFHSDTSEWDATQPYQISRFSGASCGTQNTDKLVRFAAHCRRCIAARRPDIVHAIDPPSQMALTGLSKLRLARTYFFTVHGTELLRYRNELLARLWMQGAFSKASGIAAVSHYVHDLLLSNFKVSQDHVFVSHPGISPHWFETPITDSSAVRERWGVGSEDLVLITVARRVPDKGHDRVIEGLARTPLPLRQSLVYVVVGTGPEDYAAALASRARSESIRLYLLGTLSDRELLEAYDAADVFIMLSRETPKRLEGLGLVYLEAGSRGVPSIAASTGGVPDAVRDGETGVLLTADPPAEQVAQAIQTVAEEHELRSDMGRRAREFAATFTWTRHAREIYERFSGALGKRL